MRLQTAVLLATMMPVAAVGQQAPAGDSSVETTLERMQSMMHHAVEMAAEGAQLITLADTSEPSAVDRLAADRGWEIIEDARELILEVSTGDAMMQLHATELTEDQNATMIGIHQLEQVATRYIDVIEQSLSGDTQESGSTSSH